MNRDFIEIVRAARLGDNRAFEALYNMTKDSAYFIALSITKNEQDALDIMQDSYIKAFDSISTLNAPELFDNWLGRIVANTSKNYISKKKPMLFADIVINAPIEWNDEEFNKDYIPHESVDTKETSRLLMEIIDSLSEDKRLCILMYYYQDMSVKEISDALELPVSTVKYKLLSARAEIKKGVEALEKRGTKLYGVFPFALFPAQFKNIETEFLRVNSSPAYSSLNFSAQAQSVASQAVGAVAKKGFFSTVAGKITAVATGIALVAGGVTATVIATNKLDKPTASEILKVEEPTYSDRLNETLRKHRKEFTSSDGLYECKIINDVNVRIIDYYEPNTMTKLVVPSTIDGYTVTEIGSATFSELKNTSSIKLPDTITKLSNYAFSDGSLRIEEGNYATDSDGNKLKPGEYSKGKKELYIPKGTERYKNVNPSLKEVILPDSITAIPDRCFRGCSSLEKITLPSKLEIIELSSFEYCTSLKSIEFPESLFEIQYGSFYGCSSLTQVKLPKSIKYIGGSAFEHCTALERVYLEEGMKLEDNPSRVIVIQDSFVKNNPSIKEIYIPEGFEKFDFVKYESSDHTPDYEETKERESLQLLKNITFYVKKGSKAEEIFKNCGLKYADSTKFDTTKFVPASRPASPQYLDLPEQTFGIAGVNYTLPCDYSKFIENGWSIVDSEEFDENKMLGAYATSEEYYKIKNDNNSISYANIYIKFKNISNVEAKIKDCKVASISFEVNESVSTSAKDRIIFPDGFVINSTVTIDDILDKYGEDECLQDDGTYTDDLGNLIHCDEISYQQRKGNYIGTMRFTIFDESVFKQGDAPNQFAFGYEYSLE